MYQHFPGHHLSTVTAYAFLSILKLKKNTHDEKRRYTTVTSSGIMSNIPLNKSTLKLSLPANNIDADIYLALNTMANTKTKTRLHEFSSYQSNPPLTFITDDREKSAFRIATLFKNNEHLSWHVIRMESTG